MEQRLRALCPLNDIAIIVVDVKRLLTYLFACRWSIYTPNTFINMESNNCRQVHASFNSKLKLLETFTAIISGINVSAIV